MKDKRADISQIQAYLKGKLDSKAMHQLEREAQADPFLADALDGYADSNDQQNNLAALKQRLQQRAEPKVRRLLPWTTIAIAASVVGFIIVAGLFFMRNNETKPSVQIAANEPVKSAPLPITPPQVTDSTAPKNGDKIAEPAPVQEQQVYASNTPRAKKAFGALNIPDRQTDVEAPSPVAADNNAEQAQPAADTNVSGYLAVKRLDTVLGGENVAITKKPSAVTVLKSKADGVTYKERGQQSTATTAALIAANLPNGLAGKVIDGSGAPLPGASVQVVGKTSGTLTDAYGRFSLREVKPDDQIAYGFIGYDKKVLPAKTGDSVKVMLKESANSLSEVVVVQTGTKRKGTKAAPRMGWKALNDYLKREATVSEGEDTGSVQVSFTVASNGDITDAKIAKGLNVKADERAIELIQKGPRWFGNLNGKPEVVKVTVKFSRED